LVWSLVGRILNIHNTRMMAIDSVQGMDQHWVLGLLISIRMVIHIRHCSQDRPAWL
jgi:hypothetical protein